MLHLHRGEPQFFRRKTFGKRLFACGFPSVDEALRQRIRTVSCTQVFSRACPWVFRRFFHRAVVGCYDMFWDDGHTFGGCQKAFHKAWSRVGAYGQSMVCGAMQHCNVLGMHGGVHRTRRGAAGRVLRWVKNTTAEWSKRVHGVVDTTPRRCLNDTADSF